MRVEDIQYRLQDINNEIYLLDGLREESDDTNIHIIEEQVDVLLHERRDLTYLLESCFDELIGL